MFLTNTGNTSVLLKMWPKECISRRGCILLFDVFVDVSSFSCLGACSQADKGAYSYRDDEVRSNIKTSKRVLTVFVLKLTAITVLTLLFEQYALTAFVLTFTPYSGLSSASSILILFTPSNRSSTFVDLPFRRMQFSFSFSLSLTQSYGSRFVIVIVIVHNTTSPLDKPCLSRVLPMVTVCTKT